MGHYVILVGMEVKDGLIDQFLPLAIENARRCVAEEPGCSRFDVLQVEGSPNRVTLYEVYDDQAAFDAHRNMPHVEEFLAKIRPMLAKQTGVRLLRVADVAKG